MRRGWLLLALTLLTAAAVGPAAQVSGEEASPHVVVGVPDTGINPYHEAFHRPDDPRLDDHPSTYLPNAPGPEDLHRLDLSLEIAHQEGLQAALEADQDVWDDVQPGEWYWIPETPFVAVYCEPAEQRGGAASEGSATCILDDGTDHGTGTTDSVLAENPEALIAFKQGGSSVQPFLDAGIPVDIYSVSWGYVAPLPVPQDGPGIYVKAAGNDPRPTPTDGWSGHPDTIAVGGGYYDDLHPYGTDESVGGHEEAMAAKQPDVVGPYCRQVARADAEDGTRRACGTSFSAPTVAGALSKVVLEVRESTGYTGTTQGEVLDPIAGLTQHDLRTAMNRTASYDPPRSEPVTIGPGAATHVPLNPVAPWLQWGWGFYDGEIAEDTVRQLLDDGYEHPRKSEQARLYMHSVHRARETYELFDGSSEDAMASPTPAPTSPTPRLPFVLEPIGDRPAAPSVGSLIEASLPAR